MYEAGTVLETEHLKKEFRSGKNIVTAVDDISFVLRKGECLGLVGESGSGKSTIAKLITRLTEPTKGRVFLLGKELTGQKRKELRKSCKKIQMVFQLPAESFDPRRTLGDGIGESLRNMGISRRETKKKVDELLISCGLTPEFAGKYPHEVSGGQCQRAAIARALAVKPDILICDEATSALDVTVQKQIAELLLEMKEREKLSIIFISHDLALMQAVCDRVLVLYKGKIIESGTPDKVIQSPKSEYTKQLIDSVL